MLPGKLRAITVAGWLIVGACGDPSGVWLAVCNVATGTPVSLAVSKYVSLDPASARGCFTFPANTSPVDSAEYVLIPQSAAEIPAEPSPFLLEASPAAAATAPASQLLSPLAPARSNAATFDAFLRRVGRTGVVGSVVASPGRPYAVATRAGPAAVAATPAVGDLRSFLVCGNPTCATPTGQPYTVTRWARAEAVGAHVVIYVDTITPLGGPMAGFTAGGLDSLLQVFDSRLYPLATTTFGAMSDLDGNGMVLALMTPVVNSLVSLADCHTGGFIAGFFFAGDLYPNLAQYFNNGEVYYSIVPDPDSTLSCAHDVAQVKRLAQTTFMHELQHMINFAQHVLVRGVPAEEGWLDEGLSKYGEELVARSYLPGDTATFHRFLRFNNLYDAYQYLNAPGDSYLLLLHDDGTLAEIGASWLFVRYLMDQYGSALAGRLVQSPYHGPGNIIARTGAPNFQVLVTDWALANWVSDLPGFNPDAELQYTSWSFRATFDTLHNQYPTCSDQNPACFPLSYPLVPATSAGDVVSITGWLRSGSGVYARALQGPGAPAFALRFSLSRITALPAGVVPRLTIIRIR